MWLDDILFQMEGECIFRKLVLFIIYCTVQGFKLNSQLTQPSLKVFNIKSVTDYFVDHC